MEKLIKNGETYSGSFSDASQVKYGDSNVKETLELIQTLLVGSFKQLEYLKQKGVA